MDTKLVDIFKIKKKHYNFSPSEIVESYKFNICTRKDNQIVTKYLVVLSNLGKFYNFSNKLDELIRDRLAFSIRYAHTTSIIGKVRFTLVRATDIAISVELTDYN